MGDVDLEREAIALHETGHCLLAAAFGSTLGPVTITGDGRGCSLHTPPPLVGVEPFNADSPFLVWPAGVRRSFEADVAIYAAGDIAERLFGRPAQGRQADRVIDRAVELADLPPPTVDEASWAAYVVADDSMQSDEAFIADRARWAFVGDPEGRLIWLHLIAQQTERLLLAQEAKVRHFAKALAAAGTLSAAAVQSLASGKAVLSVAG